MVESETVMLKIIELIVTLTIYEVRKFFVKTQSDDKYFFYKTWV